MKTIIATTLISLFFIGCSKQPEDLEPETEVAAVHEETYPCATLQENGSIILYTKETVPDHLGSTREVISDYIIAPETPMHRFLSKQMRDVEVGKRVPVKNADAK